MNNQYVHENFMTDLLRQAGDADEEALEGIFSSIGQMLGKFADWIGKYLSKVLIVIEDLMSVNNRAQDLSPNMRKELEDALKLFSFMANKGMILTVPPHLKKNLLGYSTVTCSTAYGLDKEMSNVLSGMKQVVSSVVSGNGLEGASTVNAAIANMQDRKDDYIKDVKKFLQPKQATMLPLPTVYGNPEEVLKTFDQLRVEAPILDMDYMKSLVRDVEEISSIVKFVKTSENSKEDILALARMLENTAEKVEFVAVVATDLLSCIGSHVSHAKTIINREK